MSPLARLRQVATCSVFASFPGSLFAALLFIGSAPFASLTLAANPSPQTTQLTQARQPFQATQLTQVRQPSQATQLTSPSQPAAATGAESSAVPASSEHAVQSPQPASGAAAASAPPPAPSGRAVQSGQPVQLAPNVTASIAHSALLMVEGTATADALQLSIRRVSDNSLISSDDVTVAVDGRNQSVTHEKGSLYELPINDLRGEGARDVDVTVAHDGIREIVSGKVSVAEASSAGSMLRDHKQVAWWILNIVIVLVAALAFSRRKG